MQPARPTVRLIHSTKQVSPVTRQLESVFMDVSAILKERHVKTVNEAGPETSASYHVTITVELARGMNQQMTLIASDVFQNTITLTRDVKFVGLSAFVI